MRTPILLLLIVVAMIAPPLHSADALAHDNDVTSLRVGVFPRRPTAETRRMMQPLVAHLSRQLQMPVTLFTPPDYPSFWRAIEQNRYDLVHYNQYHYVRAHKTLGHRLVARNEEQGSNQIRASVLVRNDSPIHTLDQLRGRKIMFGGGRGAMVSYILAVDLLREAGLDDGDYIAQFALNPPQAVTAMYFGQADAASSGRIALTSDTFTPQIGDSTQLREIAKSAAIPQLPWAVRADVPTTLQRRITRALVGLSDTPSGSPILHQLQLTAFATAVDADYDNVRAVVARILGEQY
ncbi:MAG: PhnD/SsuA/transferrin family substrate-binding protein [Gammaproteobacteria bacterium]|nr:PhnD/SsuA/transferrin family substrate-binding protein [Gammaproteobacteria bacterium]